MQVGSSDMGISNNLFGLVACGGKSSRMGTDKSLLVYYGKPQRYYACEMLRPLCEEVFLSCNREQAADIPKEYNLLTDLAEYREIGPMAGLLTAFSTFPGKDFLVIGCDYPLITKNVLHFFLNNCKQENLASAFYNDDNKYEPLLAWYSRDCGTLLKAFFDRNELSLQYFLRSVSAQKHRPKDPTVMTSVDTPEEYQNIKQLLNQQNIRHDD
jgi:molybdopterin-guanine dinucleotide biosynthesis protein A